MRYIELAFSNVQKLDVKELRSRCLDQLEIISKKRLLRIIDGQEMNSSSSESEHEAGNIPSSMEVVEDSSVVQNSQPEPKTEVGMARLLREPCRYSFLRKSLVRRCQWCSCLTGWVGNL